MAEHCEQNYWCGKLCDGLAVGVTGLFLIADGVTGLVTVCLLYTSDAADE